MSGFSNNNYFVIEGWMVNELHLSGNELLVFALIHSFTTSTGKYIGGRNYLANTLNISTRTATTILHALVKKGMLCEKVVKVGQNLYKNYSSDISKLSFETTGKNFQSCERRNCTGTAEDSTPRYQQTCTQKNATDDDRVTHAQGVLPQNEMEKVCPAPTSTTSTSHSLTTPSSEHINRMYLIAMDSAPTDAETSTLRNLTTQYGTEIVLAALKQIRRWKNSPRSGSYPEIQSVYYAKRVIENLQKSGVQIRSQSLPNLSSNLDSYTELFFYKTGGMYDKKAIREVLAKFGDLWDEHELLEAFKGICADCVTLNTENFEKCLLFPFEQTAWRLESVLSA